MFKTILGLVFITFELIAKAMAIKHDNLLSGRGLDHLNIGEECFSDLAVFAKGTEDTNSMPHWALKMIESYGGYPRDGLQEGHHYSLGAYHSCLEIGEPSDQLSPPFTSQYCHIGTFVLPKNMSDIIGSSNEDSIMGNDRGDSRGILKPLLPPFSDLLSFYPFQVSAMKGAHYGICVPSSCSMSDLDSLFHELSYNNQAAFSQVYYITHNCYSEDKDSINMPEFTWGDAAYVSVLCSFAILITWGTIVDLVKVNNTRDSKQKNASYWQAFLLGFSFYTNSKKMLDCSKGHSGQIECLNGIRFISMSWVFVSHAYTYMFMMSVPPVINGDEMSSNFTSSFLFRSPRNPVPAVDTFFTMGGCLLGYLTFKQLDKTKGRINIPMFYLHRYIRLTVVYAMVTGFYATLFKFFNWGPQNSSLDVAETCQEIWWKNLLYVNIYDTSKGICIGQSWYLSSEFQMFLFSPFVLLPMYWIGNKWGKKWSLAFNASLVVVFTLLIMILSILKDWAITAELADNIVEYTEENYYAPWARCQPYIVGIALGYILHHTRSKNIKINKFLSALLWAMSIATGIAIVYGVDIQGTLNGTTEGLSDFAKVTYNMFQHLGWGLAMSWLIFACHHGYGGWINDFLSWEAFAPLGRLSFNVYLIHYDIELLVWLTFTYSLVIDHMFVVIVTSALFAMLVVVAFFVSVCFEMPTGSIEKVIFDSISQMKNKCSKIFK